MRPIDIAALEAVRASPIARALTDEQCRVLAGLVNLRSWQRGDVLAQEGTVDDRIAKWEQTSLTWITGGNERHMTPLPRTVYGPDDWEDASLEMWLEGT